MEVPPEVGEHEFLAGPAGMCLMIFSKNIHVESKELIHTEAG